ncbi:MAG: DNA polymerase III subunit gamma/tau [Myxococcota bacterium]
MTYVVLARKWRPQNFEDVIGQQHVVQTLHNAIASGRVAHAFLFTGARGVGKTTAARLLAKALCCQEGGPRPEPCNQCAACQEITAGNSVDVLEIDGASNTGVDDVRELRESARYLPQRLRLKIFIIDEVHMLSVSAFNALLKLLEEPPPHLKFIFATTEPHKIPITILSRCQRYDFKRIPNVVMAQRLHGICKEEGIEVAPDALDVICRAAEGGMRDALSLLDQVISFVGQGQTITAQACVESLGIIDRRTVVALTEALLARDSQRALSLVREASNRGFDLKELGQNLLAELRNLTVAQVAPDPAALVDLPAVEVDALVARAKGVTAEELHRLFNTFVQRLETLSKSSEPLLGMEMSVMALCLTPPAASLQQVADLVARLEAAAGGAPIAPLPASGNGAPTTGKAGAGTTMASAAGAVTVETPKPTAPPPPAPTTTPASTTTAAPPTTPAPTTTQAPTTKPVEAAPAPAPAPTVKVSVPAGVDPKWVKILERLQGERPALVSFLDMARVKIDDTRVSIHCMQNFYLEALREAANEKALGEAVRAVLGANAAVEVRGPSDAPVDGTSVAEMREKERQEREAWRLQQVKENPAVKLAVEIFGGKIREVRPLGEA